MMSESLEGNKILNYYLIPIMDINRYKVWVAHVRSLVPPFDVIFTNNELTSTLFSEAGVEVRRPNLYDRSKYSGKEVRHRMAEDGDWRSLIPAPAVKVIEDIGGIQRIKTLSGGKA
jgi:nicotinamide-nucleotide adenylyltransferase